MKKIFTIAKWEYIERAKTKSFIIGLFLFPAIMLGFSLLPMYFATREDTEIKVIGLIEKDYNVYAELSDAMSKYKLNNGQPNYLIRKIGAEGDDQGKLKLVADSLVFKGMLQGYLFIEGMKGDSVRMEYRGENVSNIRDIERLEKQLNKLISNRRIIAEGLDVKKIEALRTDFNIKPIKISKTGQEKETSFMDVFMQGYVITLILMMLILTTGGGLIRSVVEEKSNRIVEVLVSSCTSNQLMAGKIIGLSFLGLTQVVVWGLLAITFAGPTGASFINPDTFLMTLLYFILGFIFYSGIFVAVGSTANTEQEAQQLTSYISLLLIAPVIIVFQMMNDPGTMLVKILTYFPLTTTPIMIMKMSIIQPGITEILITILVMIFAIIIVIWIAGRIFKIGILSYGKAPGLKQLISWLKIK